MVCTPETTLRDALKLMAAKNIGAVIVLDGYDVAGILSERDYDRNVVTAERISLDDPVRTLMTSPVFYATPDHTVDEIMNLMTAKHFRHLPVMTGHDLIGLISIGDVVKHILFEKDREIESLEDYLGQHDLSRGVSRDATVVIPTLFLKSGFGEQASRLHRSLAPQYHLQVPRQGGGFWGWDFVLFQEFLALSNSWLDFFPPLLEVSASGIIQ
ncbi:MAG TPA: CBS domain-containing protein [Levilinea sp.]|nr:CBS domain-containing protein [Levilinea sp.]